MSKSGFKPWRVFALNDDDEMVISGIAGRFPECHNVDELSYNLYNKIDMLTDREVRWNHDVNSEIPRRKGVLKDVHKFDNNFFSIHAKQTRVLDPQGRILVESAYEAIVDSGINPQALRGSNIGVFVANSFSESEKAYMHDVIGNESFNLTGNSRAMLANRISYTLGLTGPSFTLDTACSSGMFALDSAFNAIRSGECEAALVCGANLLLHPYTTINFTKLGVLSPTGNCRPFDTDSDGYARSETIACLFLQKIKDAKRVYARLVYSQTNCDGYKEEGITFPSTRIQQKLLSEFYANVEVDPSTVGYVEAHATGTRVGDPEECTTLDNIFCKNRSTPLLVGSVKSSIGHAEASAAIGSIIKVLLAYQTGIVSPNINIQQIRQDIPALAENRLKVCVECTPMPGPLVAVNTFGFGGANAHALFARYEKSKPKLADGTMPYLVTWAGRTKEAVDGVFDKLSSMPIDVEFNALLHNIQHDENNANMHRGYALYEAVDADAVAECIAQDTLTYDGNKRPIVWVFTGMGCQWLGMGTALMDIPLFRESIERCQEIIKPYGVDLIATITTDTESTFENGINSFVGIAAIQIALVNILRRLGVSFDYCIGHSVGELGCAYADGCFTEEQMLLAAYARGVVSRETKVIEGAMAAIGLSYNQIKDRLPDSIEIACHNSPDSATISGPIDDVRQFVAEMGEQKVFARDVPCAGVAYHSKYIAEMGPKLLEKMRAIIPQSTKRSPKWLSTSIPMDQWNLHESELSSPEYHTNNLLKPVLFEETSKLLPSNPITIEVAPHGLLQAIVKKAMPDGIHIPLTNRQNKNNLHFFLSALGRLFANGITMHIDRLYPPVQFPVSCRTPSISPLVKWDHTQDWAVNIFNYGKSDANCQRKLTIQVDTEDDKYMAGHIIDGRVLLPATGYLNMVRDTIVGMTLSRNVNLINIEFENVKFLRATSLIPKQSIHLTVTIHVGAGSFEITEGRTVIVSGNVKTVDNPEPVLEIQSATDSAFPILNKPNFYKELRLRGYHYDGIFQSVEEAHADGSSGKIRWVDNNWTAFMDCLLQMSIISSDSRALFLPTSIRKVRINTQQHLEILAKLDPANPLFDVQIFKEHDTTVGGGVEIIGLDVSAVGRRKPAGVEVWESYTFVPYTNLSSCHSAEDALRICTQCIIENAVKPNLKVLELDNGEVAPLIQLFDDVVNKMPLVDAELKIQTERTIEDLDSKYIISAENNAQAKYNVVLQANAFSMDLTSTLKGNMTDDAYLISRERSFESWISEQLPADFQVIYTIRTENEDLVLARRQSAVAQSPIVIEIDQADSDFEWLTPLQNVVKKGPVLIVSQGDRCSGLMGLLNCIRKEPHGQDIRCVIIMDENAPKFAYDDPFYRHQMGLNLIMNVYRNGSWGSYRHLAFKESQEKMPQISLCRAQIARIGDLSSFVWRTGLIKRTLSNRVDVHYSSINFKDVMMATGRLQLDAGCRLKPFELGFEFSGVNHNGERVMGMIDAGGFSTQVESFDYMVWKVPSAFSLQEAATIPVAYITVYYAFFCINSIVKGKSILIHAGSGAVGLAAIRIAFAYGLEVFTTVSTPQKKKFIMDLFPKLLESNIGNSRDSSFEKMINERTKGKGVDYVLNSLSEEKLLASVRCLGLGGIFLEIGKFDFMNNSNLGMGVFKKEITFRSVFADNLIYRPDMREKVFDLIDIDLRKGIIQPLKSTVFQVDEIEKAFRYLSTGKHMGKVMMQIRFDETAKETVPINVTKMVDFDPKMVYILVGCLGGFGLELADWMVLRGARKLVISSRRGVTNSYQAFRTRLWESYGCEVYIDSNDITTYAGCKKMLQTATAYGGVGGIFNLAMVLQDSIFENQTVEKFRDCLAPKAYATQYLDEQSRQLCPQLQHFVVFSSASCGRGNPGQSNYGMANSIMERIVERRVEQGLPGKAIQWGAVGEVGFFAQMTDNKLDVEIAGTIQQRLASCLEALDALLTSAEPIVSTMVVAQKKIASRFSAIGNVLNVMGLSDIKKVPKRSTLVELGMDSLMAVEIKQILEREWDLILTTTDLRALTFDKLLEISLAKSNKDFDGEKLLSANTAPKPAGLKLIIKEMTVEDFETGTMVKLNKTAVGDDKEIIILIPGIEGIVVGGLRDLGRRILSRDVYALNVQKYARTAKFDDLISAFFEEVQNKFKGKRSFTLVSHSFGANIALELSRRLELTGLRGRLLLIDGHPRLLKQMAIAAFNDREITTDNATDIVMENYMSLVLPDVDPTTIASLIKGHDTLEAKISAFDGFAKMKIYSSKSIYEFVLGIRNRLAMVVATPDEFGNKIEASITLVRPSEASEVTAMDDRKQLETYTSGITDVSFVEGSHISMLENGNLLKYINEIYLVE